MGDPGGDARDRGASRCEWGFVRGGGASLCQPGTREGRGSFQFHLRSQKVDVILVMGGGVVEPTLLRLSLVDVSSRPRVCYL